MIGEVLLSFAGSDSCFQFIKHHQVVIMGDEGYVLTLFGQIKTSMK